LSGLVIRPATTADLPAVRDVLVETWHATYDATLGVAVVDEITGRWHALDVLAAQLADQTCLRLIAEQGERIVGTLLATRGCDGLTLNQLYVLPAEQGQGAGLALFQAMQRQFGADTPVTLEVEPRNTGAIAFYERLGFRVVGSGGACGGDQGAGIAHLTMWRP
jgi:ribosomal protein S18 acetylase RimI-like enzyme